MRWKKTGRYKINPRSPGSPSWWWAAPRSTPPSGSLWGRGLSRRPSRRPPFPGASSGSEKSVVLNKLAFVSIEKWLDRRNESWSHLSQALHTNREIQLENLGSMTGSGNSVEFYAEMRKEIQTSSRIFWSSELPFRNPSKPTLKRKRQHWTTMVQSKMEM